MQWYHPASHWVKSDVRYDGHSCGDRVGKVEAAHPLPESAKDGAPCIPKATQRQMEGWPPRQNHPWFFQDLCTAYFHLPDPPATSPDKRRYRTSGVVVRHLSGNATQYKRAPLLE